MWGRDMSNNEDMHAPERHLSTPGQRGHSPQRHTCTPRRCFGESVTSQLAGLLVSVGLGDKAPVEDTYCLCYVCPLRS